MTISDNLNRIINAKVNIKQAIESKGVSVSDNALLDEYPALIDSIEVGSGGGNSYYEDLYNIRTNNGTNMDSLFARTSGELDLRILDTSNVTSIKYMFDNSSASVNIDGWNTSNVTDMSYMFYYFTGSVDISKLDTSKVTNASYMLSSANTDKIILTGLSFPSATSLQYMFSSAKGTTLDLSSWDISNVTNMSSIFAGDFKKIDLTGWNTSHVTNMGSMFGKYGNPLVELIIPDWDMSNCDNSNIFYKDSYIPNLKLIDLSRSNDATITKIASFLPTRTTTTFGTVIVPYDTSQETYDALVAKYWRPIGATIGPVPTSCSIVAELDEIYPGKSTKVYLGAYEPWNGDPSKVEIVVLDSSIATIDKDNRVTSTGVLGDIVLEARIKDTQEIIGTKTIAVSEVDNYPNLVKFKITEISQYNDTAIIVNNVNIKRSQLDYDSYSNIFSYNSSSDITSIRFYASMYASIYLSELIKLNISNVTDMNCMFDNSKSLTELDASNWNTSNVTNMSYMFNGCESLISVDLSNFDTSNVTSMVNMFNRCSKLHTLHLDNCNNDTINKIITSSNFPTNTIEGVTRTIYCREENIGDLVAPTNWVFSFVAEEEPEVPVDPPAGDIPLYVPGEFAYSSATEVTTMVNESHTDLSYMFDWCINLVSVNTQDWDTCNVTNTAMMFNNCQAIESVDLSNWDTRNLSNATFMFDSCINLRSIDLNNWNINNIVDITGMFARCSSLTELDLSNWNTSNITNMNGLFRECPLLQSVDMRNWDASNSYNVDAMFADCTSLTTLRLDNCSHDTITKIINSESFPVSNAGNIYCKAENAANLTLPEGFNWIFEYID